MCALVPPFRADDMQGLYKKVIKGKFPRIPDHFSQEMATVIKFMLQISPSYRPSCDQILNLPIVQALSKKFFPAELNSELENDDQQSLLRTIRISRNLFSLTERLPKSKYRGRSNDLPRNNSVDSHGPRMQHAITLNGSAGNINNKLKQMGVNSQMDMQDSMDGGSPGKLIALKYKISIHLCYSCYVVFLVYMCHYIPHSRQNIKDCTRQRRGSIASDRVGQQEEPEQGWYNL